MASSLLSKLSLSSTSPSFFSSNSSSSLPSNSNLSAPSTRAASSPAAAFAPLEMATSIHDCELGPSFDVTLRCTVLLLCAVALVSKKCREGPERRWDDFGLDAAKQLVGAAFATLFFSTTLGEFSGEITQCDDRWIRLVLGGTVCVVFEQLVLNIATSLFEGAVGDTGDFTTGEYRDADGRFVLLKFTKQLGLWLGCVFLACTFQAWLLETFGPQLQAIGHFVLALVSWNSDLEKAFVDVITPCVVTVFQVCFTDDFLQMGGLPLSEVVADFGARMIPPLTSAASGAGQWVLASGSSAFAAAGPGRREQRLLPLLSTEVDPKYTPSGGRSLNNVFGHPTASTPYVPPQASGGARWGSPSPGMASPTISQGPARSIYVEDPRRQVMSPSGYPQSPIPQQQHRGRSPSPSPSRAWMTVPAQQEEEAPYYYQHPELQQALEGMEFQVARAVGCQPPPATWDEAEAALTVDMHVDPFFSKPWTTVEGAEALHQCHLHQKAVERWESHNNSRGSPPGNSTGLSSTRVGSSLGYQQQSSFNSRNSTIAALRSASPYREPPELEELKHRIQEKDEVLARLRSELVRDSPKENRGRSPSPLPRIQQQARPLQQSLRSQQQQQQQQQRQQQQQQQQQPLQQQQRQQHQQQQLQGRAGGPLQYSGSREALSPPASAWRTGQDDQRKALIPSEPSQLPLADRWSEEDHDLALAHLTFGPARSPGSSSWGGAPPPRGSPSHTTTASPAWESATTQIDGKIAALEAKLGRLGRGGKDGGGSSNGR